MERLKVAILGASGIGKFHFREFMNAGVEVVAILGSSPKSAAKTARSLGEQFGVTPKAYSKLSDLIEAEKLDAVSICTPPELHYAQTRKCLESGLHVLCEKPFVLNSRSENYELARQLVELANDGGKVLSVNTQWPAILKYIQKDVDLSKLNQFSMYMEPGASGIDMLTDHLAHTNSILVRLIPEGHAQDIKFTMPNRDEIQTSFTYSNEDSECNVDYSFKSKANRPRKVSFSFNDKEFKREIGENYQQMLVSNGKIYKIDDPLKISIRQFMAAIKQTDFPLVSGEEILENIKLQDEIIAAYAKEN